jgi:hypothetical protein
VRAYCQCRHATTTAPFAEPAASHSPLVEQGVSRYAALAKEVASFEAALLGTGTCPTFDARAPQHLRASACSVSTTRATTRKLWLHPAGVLRMRAAPLKRC